MDRRIRIPAGYRYYFYLNSFVVSIVCQSAAAGTILQFRNSAYNNSGLKITNNGDGTITVLLRNWNGQDYTVTSPSTMIATSPVRITLNKSGVNAELYINGALMATVSVGSGQFFLAQTGDYAYIGSDYTGANYLAGTVSNLFVMTAAFSLADLVTYHTTNVIPTLYHPYIVANYPLTNKTGDKAFDVCTQFNYSRPAGWDKYTAGITTSDVEVVAPGATVVLSSGSDGDGAYIQAELSAYTTGSAYFRVTASAATASAKQMRQKLKWKLMSGTRVSISDFLAGANTIIDSAVVGTAVMNRDISFNHTWSGNPSINFADGGFAPIVGGIVRVYGWLFDGKIEANHGEIQNLSNEEAGITNPMLQSGWYELAKNKKWLVGVPKLNQSNQYLQIPSYSSINLTNKTLFISHHNNGYTYDLRAIFTSDGGTRNLLLFPQSSIEDRWWLGPGGEANTGGVHGSLPFHQNLATFIANSMTAYSYNGTGTTLATPYTDYIVNAFTFAKGGPWGSSYGKFQGVKFVLIDRVITADERGLLYNSSKDDKYKTIPNILVDIDFSDIFLSGGNYFARDTSGNNRHAQLYNWTTAQQPLILERPSLMPLFSKALRFVRASNHYLETPSFNPTAESGYTHIIGFCLDSNRNFHDYEFVLSKRNAGNTKRKIFWGNGAGGKDFNIDYDNDTTITTISAGNLSNYDTSKPVFICTTETASLWTRMINGMTQGTSPMGPVSYSEIDSDSLFIGGDDSAFSSTYSLGGYIFFVGIWKGVLTQKQIQRIVNNSFGANRTELMTNCHLYLTFEEIINDAGTYKIKDWSPQNRTVVLNNYTANDIDPAHANYKLFSLDTLR